MGDKCHARRFHSLAHSLDGFLAIPVDEGGLSDGMLSKEEYCDFLSGGKELDIHTLANSDYT